VPLFEFRGRGGRSIVSDDNVVFARSMATLLDEYFTLKRNHRAGYDLLASYIESLAKRLGVTLSQSGDIRESLMQIDAEIDRLKNVDP
jgi:hypothetical protein